MIISVYLTGRDMTDVANADWYRGTWDLDWGWIMRLRDPWIRYNQHLYVVRYKHNL